VRRIVWLGSAAAAALLIVLVAVLGLRGTSSSSPAPQPGPVTAALQSPVGPARLARPAPSEKLPSFDIVRVEPQGHAVIAGRAAPGDRVRVLDGGKPIGEVTADARGEWVLVPDAPLAPGNRQLYLEATGKEGGPVRRSADTVALSVTSPVAAGGRPSTLAVLLPGDADKPARVLQKPTLSEGQPLSLDTAEYDARKGLMLSGHAEPAAPVNIYAGDHLIGTVTADEAGKWSFSAAHAQPMAGVELRLDELAADGSVAHRVAAPFAAVAPGLVASGEVAAGGSYVVRSGNSLWVIARELYGKGFRYTAIYSANRDQIRDPDKIYPGQTFKLPKS
jgi:nucleoid-associated protein YgaU